MGTASNDDAALDAEIARSGLVLPGGTLVAVRAGVRRLQASVERLRAAGFDEPPIGDAREPGR